MFGHPSSEFPGIRGDLDTILPALRSAEVASAKIVVFRGAELSRLLSHQGVHPAWLSPFIR